MNHSCQNLTAAASKVHFVPVTGTSADVHSSENDCLSFMFSGVSMHHSSCGDFASQEVYHTKKDSEYPITRQSGVEQNGKSFSISKYSRSKEHRTQAKSKIRRAERTSTQKVVWKQQYSKVVTNQLDVVHEESLEPHFGFENFSSAQFIIDILATRAGLKCSDDVIKEVEGISALLIALTKSADMTGVAACLFLYVRNRFSTSLSSMLVKYISDVMSLTYQSGDEGAVDDDPEWLKFLKNIRTDWTSCTGSGLFENFSKILGMLVVSGLADAAQLTFKLGSIKMLEPDMKTITQSATDLVGATCDLVVFFAERCYHCWRQGSFRPLFSASLESAELEVKYNNLMNNWDLYRNGNLVKIGNTNEHDFFAELNEMGDKLRTLMNGSKGIDKRLLEDKFRNITKIIGSFTLIKVNSGFRKAPFCIQYYGLSKVGKSTISEQIAHYIFTSAGLPLDEGRKYTHVTGKKHWDGARSDMLELKLDDHANTKAEFVEVSPCDAIIKVCNNVCYNPPMADLNEKGKVWIEPKLVSLTTNVEDLASRTYSVNPYSIQRRMHYIVEVCVRPEFVSKAGDAVLGLDSERIIESHTKDGVYDPPPYHDAWEVNIKIAIPGKTETEAGTYKIVEHNGKYLKKIRIAEACNFLCEMYHKHDSEQSKLEASQRNKKVVDKCPIEGCCQLKGYCLKHPEPQWGGEAISAMTRITEEIRNVDIAGITREKLLRARSFYDSHSWVPEYPTWALSFRGVQMLACLFNAKQLAKNYVRTSCMNVLLHLMPLVGAFVLSGRSFASTIVGLLCLLSFCFVQYTMIGIVRDRYIAELRNRYTLTEIQKRWHSDIIKGVFAGSAVLGTFYMLAKTYKSWKSLNIQGSLEPKSQEEVDSRDKETNVWTSMVKRDLPIHEHSKRMSTEQLANVVQKALVYGTIHDENHGNGMMNGLMVSSNAMLVPHHYFDEFGETLNCTFRKKNPEASGGKFVARLSLSLSHLIPGTDLRVCYVPTGGSYKNIVDYFPVEEMPGVPFHMYWRKKTGDVIVAKGLTQPGVVTTYMSFKGGMYKNLTINTFDGMCGGTLISDTNGCAIIGVHLGGSSGTPIGCYGSVLQQELMTAFAELRKKEGVILSGEAGKFEKKVLDVQVLKEDPLHVKSALNYLPDNSQVEYFGSCPGRGITKTDVKVTPISEHIMDVCGVPNIYRGPKLNPDWFGWQTCLANLAVPAHPFEPKLLEIAIRDYKEPLLKIFKSKLWNTARPLTDKENLCGIPGKKFMDAIKLNTSVGFPLSGPKREYVVELEPTEEWPNNRELESVLMDEINRIEDCYRRGERGYPIAKACKKDEILAKDKCRIFYGNALSLTYLIRKYYLPLLRVLQMNPLMSECAVGINSHGPEWDEFHKYATKFGMDRLFGGDYGKYDQKLPSQLIFAALRILIDFARCCDYSEEDIAVMEAMTGDIVFAYIAFNGDLIGLTEGTHISGNSLTVIINGICGSLNLRCFFYSEYPCNDFDSRMKFRECVAAMTYGDDNIGSVRKDISKFTIKGCSQFLAKYGQVYTMPDKESELLDFLPEEEFEFLKRSSVYHPRLGKHIGALLDASIYKSLHCYMRGKNCVDTPEMACAQNIDGALREWFNHGPDKYERQRILMQEVANRAGISHLCTGLHETYVDRVNDWYSKYGARSSESS